MNQIHNLQLPHGREKNMHPTYSKPNITKKLIGTVSEQEINKIAIKFM